MTVARGRVAAGSIPVDGVPATGCSSRKGAGECSARPVAGWSPAMSENTTTNDKRTELLRDGAVSVVENENGTGHAKMPMYEDVEAYVELHGSDDAQALFRVLGYWYDDDEQPGVEVSIITDAATVKTALSLEDAQELAADLEAAADLAAERQDAGPE